MEQPASEINFWRAYYNIFPFPQERAEARAASISQTVTNMSGKRLKDGVYVELSEFLPDYLDERNKPPTERELIDAEKRFAEQALESGFGKMESK